MIPKMIPTGTVTTQAQTVERANRFLKGTDPENVVVRALAVRSNDLGRTLISEGRALAADKSLSAPKREALASRVRELETTFSREGRLQIAKERMVFAREKASWGVSSAEVRAKGYMPTSGFSNFKCKMKIQDERNNAYYSAKADYEALLAETSEKAPESK